MAIKTTRQAYNKIGGHTYNTVSVSRRLEWTTMMISDGLESAVLGAGPGQLMPGSKSQAKMGRGDTMFNSPTYNGCMAGWSYVVSNLFVDPAYITPPEVVNELFSKGLLTFTVGPDEFAQYPLNIVMPHVKVLICEECGALRVTRSSLTSTESVGATLLTPVSIRDRVPFGFKVEFSSPLAAYGGEWKMRVGFLSHTSIPLM